MQIERTVGPIGVQLVFVVDGRVQGDVRVVSIACPELLAVVAVLPVADHDQRQGTVGGKRLQDEMDVVLRFNTAHAKGIGSSCCHRLSAPYSIRLQGLW